jgi:hypothetical protein
LINCGRSSAFAWKRSDAAASLRGRIAIGTFILSSGLDKRTADEQTAAQLLMAGRDDEERRIMNLP